MVYLDEPVQFHKAVDVQTFIAALQRLPAPPVLLVIDPLSRCFVGGNQRDETDVGLFLEGLEQVRRTIGCAILVLHHSTKDGESDRGSPALVGLVHGREGDAHERRPGDLVRADEERRGVPEDGVRAGAEPQQPGRFDRRTEMDHAQQHRVADCPDAPGSLPGQWRAGWRAPVGERRRQDRVLRGDANPVQARVCAEPRQGAARRLAVDAGRSAPLAARDSSDSPVDCPDDAGNSPRPGVCPDDQDDRPESDDDVYFGETS